MIKHAQSCGFIWAVVAHMSSRTARAQRNPVSKKTKQKITKKQKQSYRFDPQSKIHHTWWYISMISAVKRITSSRSLSARLHKTPS